MIPESILPLIMFFGLIVFIMSGFPVAFSLAGTAMVFAAIGYSFDLMSFSSFALVPIRVFGIMENVTLMAVPMFVFMGLILEKADIAKELLETMDVLFGKIRGGLAISVVMVGALLAASTGIVGATVVTMGILSLPTMLKKGYRKEFTCGVIAASGTLGQIIPPSIVLVLLGDIMNVDVGSLFVAAIIPGLMLVTGYIIYIFIKLKNSNSMQSNSYIDEAPVKKDLFILILKSLCPPAILIFIVLGSILGGFASPTEAAGCGALGGIFIAFFKKRLNIHVLRSVSIDTAKITSMVFTILIGAQFFSLVFRLLHGEAMIQDFFLGLRLNKFIIVFFIMAIMFVLGFFLDFLEICFIIIPIIMPVLANLGFNTEQNLLYLAILIAINLQTSFLTPPFGFSLFYLKGVTPPEVKTIDIYRGVIPFVAIQLIVLVILAALPNLILWLPQMVFK